MTPFAPQSGQRSHLPIRPQSGPGGAGEFSPCNHGQVRAGERSPGVSRRRELQPRMGGAKPSTQSLLPGSRRCAPNLKKIASAQRQTRGAPPATVELYVEYTVEGEPVWRPFRLSLKGSFLKPPIGLRAGPDRIVPPSCATRCGNTCRDWRCAPWKSGTAKAIRSGRGHPVNLGYGKRRRRGRQNSPRGCPPLQFCSA